jgi:hypothetical protein
MEGLHESNKDAHNSEEVGWVEDLHAAVPGGEAEAAAKAGLATGAGQVIARSNDDTIKLPIAHCAE